MDKTQINKKKKAIVYFFTYAFLGWALETIFCLVTLGTFLKRGFLYGPICPMYGYAAISMIYFLRKIKSNTISKFFLCMILFTIFEYIVAVVLEALFGLRWWDYSNERFNFQGRISLPYSIAWGIIGVVFVEMIHPRVKKIVEKIENKINLKVFNVLLYFIICIYFLDTVLSVIKYIRM